MTEPASNNLKIVAVQLLEATDPDPRVMQGENIYFALISAHINICFGLFRLQNIFYLLSNIFLSTELILTGNKIVEISPEINKLTDLRKLMLGNNQITRVPDLSSCVRMGEQKSPFFLQCLRNNDYEKEKGSSIF